MKSGFPYLVDCKITDFCPFGCPFCYQSSTKKGKGADDSFLTYYLPTILRDSNVLEINFGGGEPTLYTMKYGKFSSVANAFKAKHFRVGVTTKNYKWHTQPDFTHAIQHIDSVAISINNMDDLEKSYALEDAIHYPTRTYAQLIFGLSPWEEFRKLFNEIHENGNYRNITLLGFKDFGFSENQKAHEYPENWIEEIKKFTAKYGTNLGVDSVMVNKYRNELIDVGVKPYYLVGREGDSSCFIDAVKQQVYPSSFAKGHGGLPISSKTKPQEFLDIFAQL
jgi:organic radical activating enzyme